MSNESVVVIILRLSGFYIGAVAVYHFIQVLIGLPFGNAAALKPWLIWLVYFLVVAAFAWFLIRFPRLITRRLLARKEAEETTTTGWSLDELQSVLFSVVGLYFVVGVAGTMVGWIANFGFASVSENTGVTLHFGFDTLVAELFQLAVGVWLLFGAAGLRGLIRRARRAGQGG